jgi:hypothetical protein
MPLILAHKNYHSQQCCRSRIRIFVHPGSGLFSYLESLSPWDLNFTIWKLFHFSTGASKGLIQLTKNNVVDPGCLTRIWLFSISDPGFELSPSRICIKEFKYCSPKIWVPSSRKYDPGCPSRILFTHPDSGSRGQKCTASRIRNND